MTVRDAYRALDLAPGLGKDRVESQFQRLTIDLKNRLSQSKSPNLQTFYASRLEEIEAAKAILDQHFAPDEAKVSDVSDNSGIDTEATDDPVDGQQETDDPIDGQQASDNIDSDSTPTFGNNEVNEPDSLTLKSYMFSKPFSFEGRIRRTEYCLSFIIHYTLGILLSESANGPEVLFFLIPIWWFALAQGVKRCHDRGNSGWYCFIPFYILWMFFGDSEDGINEYGPNPKGIGN
jgi:uncharacterized membrane protein YhaH (DUF805 family)